MLPLPAARCPLPAAGAAACGSVEATQRFLRFDSLGGATHVLPAAKRGLDLAGAFRALRNFHFAAIG